MRSWLPVSTPAGILICSVRSTGTWPSPRQVLQGSATMRPVPRQWLQVRATLKKPCWKVTWPAPRQVGQVVGLVPGAAPLPEQVAQVLGARDAELRLGAEGRLLEGDLEVVAQVRAPARAAPRRPKTSPKPKKSPRMSLKSAKIVGSKPAPPAPPTPAWP